MMKIFKKIKSVLRRKKKESVITGRWRYATDGKTKIPVKDDEK